MSLNLNQLKERLAAVEEALSARVSGSGGIGGATTEMRKGDRTQRWAQLSYDELVKEYERLSELIRKAEAKESGGSTRRAAWMY